MKLIIVPFFDTAHFFVIHDDKIIFHKRVPVNPNDLYLRSLYMKKQSRIIKDDVICNKYPSYKDFFNVTYKIKEFNNKLKDMLCSSDHVIQEMALKLMIDE